MHLTNQPNLIINVYNLIFFWLTSFQDFGNPPNSLTPYPTLGKEFPIQNKLELVFTLHLAALLQNSQSDGDCKCDGGKGKQREVFNFRQAKNIFSNIKTPFPLKLLLLPNVFLVSSILYFSILSSSAAVFQAISPRPTIEAAWQLLSGISIQPISRNIYPLPQNCPEYFSVTS